MNAVIVRRRTWLVVILLPFVAGGIQQKSFIGALSAADGWLFFEENPQRPCGTLESGVAARLPASSAADCQTR